MVQAYKWAGAGGGGAYRAACTARHSRRSGAAACLPVCWPKVCLPRLGASASPGTHPCLLPRPYWLPRPCLLRFPPPDAPSLSLLPSPRRDLLAYSQTSAVTRNAAEKKVNSVLDFVSQSTDTELLQVGGSACRVVGGC